MDAFWAPFPQNSAVSGTSDLFSSSVAMIGDGYQPYQENWCEQPKHIIPVNFPQFFDQPTDVIPDGAMNFGVHANPQLYNSYENNTTFPVYHAEQMAQAQLVARHQAAQQAAATVAVAEEVIQKEHYFAKKIVDSEMIGTSPTTMTTITIPNNPRNTPGKDSRVNIPIESRRPSSVCNSELPGRSPVTSSESGIENDGSPGGSEVNPSDMEEGEGRVMCQACKGLYPSRRSLTGHIGRNEKCREIIGRTYIDQATTGSNPMTYPDSNLRPSNLTNGQDGLSPICPHCDKFISHYKLQGNIRRHINTCGKNSNLRKSRPEKERKRRRRIDDGPPALIQDSFEHAPPIFNSMYTDTAVHGQMHNYPHVSQRADHSIHAPQPQMPLQNINVTIPTDPSPPNPLKREEPPDDAYICSLCDFVTIYKGNMKRHLNTCHKSNDCKDLKEWDRKLESMKASTMGMSRDEMLQRLHMHRMNSTRGRKPGKKQCPDLPPVQHLPPNMHQSQPVNQISQVPPMQPPSMHPHVMNHHIHPQDQMAMQNHLTMPIHSQDVDMFSMPQMPPMHYGYDMGGYI